MEGVGEAWIGISGVASEGGYHGRGLDRRAGFRSGRTTLRAAGRRRGCSQGHDRGQVFDGLILGVAQKRPHFLEHLRVPGGTGRQRGCEPGKHALQHVGDTPALETAHRLDRLGDRELWALQIQLAVVQGKDVLEEKLKKVVSGE